MAINKIILSLGSNLGDRISFLQKALDELQLIGKVTKCSSVYETPPWGFESEHSFYNICIQLESEISPEKLLIKNKEIEEKLGRKKMSTERYESRVIDIDIIFYDQQLFFSENLQIPHSEYEKREFVLFPLFEIAKNWKDPRSGKSIAEIMQKPKKVTTIKPIKQQVFINK